MRAFVLSAGLGKRLGALTDAVPKPMLDVAGRPLLAWVIANLARSGYDEIGVNLHYRPKAVSAYFGDGRAFGVRIWYFLEPELLGTAGAIAAARDFLGEVDAFLVHYGDVLTDQDLASMHRFHGERGALATLLVHKRARSNSIVELDPDGRVVAFRERPSGDRADDLIPPAAWVNSGVHVCSPALLDFIPEPPSDLAADVFAVLGSRPPDVYGYPLSGYRCAIDSAARYREAVLAVSEGRFVFPEAG